MQAIVELTAVRLYWTLHLLGATGSSDSKKIRLRRPSPYFFWKWRCFKENSKEKVPMVIWRFSSKSYTIVVWNFDSSVNGLKQQVGTGTWEREGWFWKVKRKFLNYERLIGSVVKWRRPIGNDYTRHRENHKNKSSSRTNIKFQKIRQEFRDKSSYGIKSWRDFFVCRQDP